MYQTSQLLSNSQTNATIYDVVVSESPELAGCYIREVLHKKCTNFFGARRYIGTSGMHDTKLNMGSRIFEAKPGPRT